MKGVEMAEVFAVIMSGGRGERLWPLSTPVRPKQFLPLLSGKSFLQATAERVIPLVGKEGLFVVVPREYNELVAKELSLPWDQIIVEPEGRNTAPALGLSSLVLSARDPKAVMIALPSDHLVTKVEEFQRILRVAVELAEKGEYLVTLGIKPDRPATGYGYIRYAELFAETQGIPVYRVEQFVEKPDRTKAEAFLAEGCYLWNSGIFVWRLDTFMHALSLHMPELYSGLLELREHLGKPSWEGALVQLYSRLPAISIDYGLMEKAQNVLVIPADIGWSDVGDWSAVSNLFPKDESGNAVWAKHLGIDTENCVIYAEEPGRLVATLGLRDLVIVETKEALLILPRDRAQEVRKILERLRKLP
jgi:mannose-1-phosphate guanylyltransferase